MSLTDYGWTINKSPRVHSFGLLKFKSYFLSTYFMQGNQTTKDELLVKRALFSGGGSLRFTLHFFLGKERNCILFPEKLAQFLQWWAYFQPRSEQAGSKEQCVGTSSSSIFPANLLISLKFPIMELIPTSESQV